MKKIVVLGAGESGVGAAILAQQKGYEVFVSDAGRIKDAYKAMLDAHQLPWEEGQHTMARIVDADECVKSPGIPETAPVVQALVERQVPIIGELEFASRFLHGQTICITGSNGKTTTTSLIYYILQKAGFSVALGGNIGKSLALQVAEGEEHDWTVLEVSSFQLDTMYDFRADISVLLNITPDHLDRYGYVMQRYVDSKMRIIRNQRRQDCFIYWRDDEYADAELSKRRAAGNDVTALPFTDAPQDGSFGCDRDGMMCIDVPEGLTVRLEDGAQLSIPVAELSIPGRHNVRNCLAAAMAALAAGVDADTVKECLRTFPGVEHRLEFVCEAHGVRYVNDSKATNVDACHVALEAQTTPVVLIVGGTDKGNDYTTLFSLISRKCRAIVFLGADNSTLHKAFDAFAAEHGIAIADTHSMPECVAAAAGLAQAGDTVLLSPCCASFDLFQNMGHRGRLFKEEARKL